MRTAKLLLFCLPWLAACAPQDGSQDAPQSTPAPTPPLTGAILFEGARLIFGDASGPLENSAFLVEDGHFVQVGNVGEIALPAGATHVDLTGKTVMPAIVDLHVHPGYADIKEVTDSRANYSRDNLIDHLHRIAYHGVAAALSMGLDPGDMPYRLRAQTIPDAARFRLAGAGIARPNAGPGATDRRDVAYGVDTEAEARAAVAELAARNVDIVKIWVDNRGGSVEKLTPRSLWGNYR